MVFPPSGCFSKFPLGKTSRHPAVPRSVVAGARSPAPSRPLAFAENEQADRPKCGARPRRDQGPVDRFARMHVARRRHGAVRPERPQNPGGRPAPPHARRPRRCQPASRILPVVTILGHDLARHLAEAHLAEQVRVRPANGIARQGSSHRERSETQNNRPSLRQGKLAEKLGAEHPGHVVIAPRGRFRRWRRRGACPTRCDAWSPPGRRNDTSSPCPTKAPARCTASSWPRSALSTWERPIAVCGSPCRRPRGPDPRRDRPTALRPNRAPPVHALAAWLAAEGITPGLVVRRVWLPNNAQPGEPPPLPSSAAKQSHPRGSPRASRHVRRKPGQADVISVATA